MPDYFYWDQFDMIVADTPKLKALLTEPTIFDEDYEFEDEFNDEHRYMDDKYDCAP